MLLLLGQGFFMGVLIATYTVGAETLFVSTVGEHYLARAIFLSGVMGIISAGAYVQFQKKINFSTLLLTITFLVFLFIAGIRGAFWYTDYQTEHLGFHYLPFILFVMMGPVISITVLSFWGVFGRIWDLKQAKRIIGGIDTGQLVATMIAFFSIPLLSAINIINETHDLLLLSTIAAFGIMVFALIIVKNFNLDSATKIRPSDARVRKITYLDLFKDKYLRMLCVFMVFSMASAVFANFVYLSATEIMYPDEKELRTFLSFTNGTVMVLSFFIQSFINDIIIGKYGLRVSLMVMPLVLALFTLGAIFSGHLFVYDIKTDDFLFFFIFLVVGKVFTSSLKDALENPAFKLFFLPFDVKIRFDIQSRIEGVVNEIAVLVAGALQIALGTLTFFKLIHYAYFIVVLAALIMFYAGKLFNEYKIQLKKTLEDQKNKLKGSGTRNDHNTVNVIKNELRKRNPVLVLNALKLLERMEPIMLDFSLLDFIRSEHKHIRIYAYQRLGYLKSFNTLEILAREIRKEEDDDVKRIGIETIKALKEMVDYELTEVGIKKLVRSTDTEDRVYAARVLAKLEDDKFVPFLVELLRDINPQVRQAAMVSAGKLKRPEFWSILIENLHLPTYSNTADSALISSGETMFHAIDSAFYKTGQEVDTMIRIMQIFGKVGGRQATEMLWKKIDFPDKNIISELLLSLSYIGFEAKDFHAARIKLAIESTISDLTWNIKALLEIPRDDFFDRLIVQAFEEENKKNHEHLFMLMSMIYDAQSIKLVRDNIEVGTTDSVSFGIEMLGIFVDEILRPKLTAVLDDDEPKAKLDKLHDFYPPESFEDYSDLLLQIVNRDYNNINKWTKCLAMYKLTLIRGQKVTNDLIANLFNPDETMVQTAAAVLYKLDSDQYQYHTKRLKSTTKKKLDKAIVPAVFKNKDEKYHQKLLVIERAVLLKQIPSFMDIPGVILLDLAKRFDEIMVEPNVTIMEQGDSGDAPIYIVISGQLTMTFENGDVKKLEERNIVGHKLLLSSDVCTYSLVTDTECLLLTIEKGELYDAVSKNIEMVDGILTIINEAEIEEEVESIFH
ncbi:cyclic nucleotide-binding domain-containing protein [Reichenbachiella carrageenanivorans]|uniref:Cyclic nucleotide-binding domain-containing protein n=1 Tax=Reichenbachiella carrageenanivorans TaxID=2979869 RepID=A0ABY6CZI1_9BACT|nr:cyclic nucleotide-binding domain-containing protein [Reichenbachiella carrageenanivorans]UXX79322.1 cyclic nucleotide-binding domain-containing protein [Reichenbachiella carrageenanivorans]